MVSKVDKAGNPTERTNFTFKLIEHREEIAEAFPKKLQQNTQGLDKFEIYVKHQVDLDNRNISQELRQEFENNGILLSSTARVAITKRGKRWRIIDNKQKWLAEVKKDVIEIRKPW